MLRECVAMAVAIGATGTVRSQEPPAKHESPVSPLDDLIAKSRQVQSFTATFTMSGDDEPAPANIRCEYRASSGCRVVIASSESELSAWYVDRVLTMRLAPKSADDSSKGGHARIDSRDFDAPMDAVFAALEREFAAPTDKWPVRSTVTMNWAFDAATDQGDFRIWAGELSGDASPFGWLETLREKRVDPKVDGDTLRFSTDGGRCDVVIDRQNGFLQEFVGRGATKTLRVHLESVVLNAAGGIPDLEPPRDAGGGEDMSPAWHANFEHNAIAGIRERVYEVISKAAGDEPWSDEFKGKMRRTLRPLDDWGLHAWIDPWVAETRRWIPEVAAWIRVGRESGVDPAKVANALEESKAKLIDSLAGGKTKAVRSLIAPTDATFPERAARLLEIEREVMAQSFDSTVGDPLMAEFTKATAGAQK